MKKTTKPIKNLAAPRYALYLLTVCISMLSYHISNAQALDSSIQKRAERVKRANFKEGASLWPNNTVPYSLASLDKAPLSTRMAFLAAAKELHTKTNLRLVPKTDQETHYLEIRSFPFEVGKGICGLSRVGRKTKAGAQELSFANADKCQTQGIVLHELMHAAGFYHEHDRPDRNSYISLTDLKLAELRKQNPDKYSADDSAQRILDKHSPTNPHSQPIGAFDYDSVTIYDGIFQKKPWDPDAEDGLIVQADQLSDGDIKGINQIYPSKQETPSASVVPSITPSQIKILPGERRDISVQAPCSAKLAFMLPAGVKLTDHWSCQGGQHVFRVQVIQAFKALDRFLTVTANLKDGSPPRALKVNLIPSARVARSALRMTDKETGTITVLADCDASVTVGNVPGLTITAANAQSCQHGKRQFNVTANGIRPQKFIVPIRVQYDQTHEETLHQVIRFRPSRT